MEKSFCLGLVLGAIGGALLVANSYKMRCLVKKSQAEVAQKMDEMMDERLQQMQCANGKCEKSENQGK